MVTKKELIISRLQRLLPVNIYAFIQDGYYGSLLGRARINCDLFLENVHKKLKKDLNTVFLQCALAVL